MNRYADPSATPRLRRTPRADRVRRPQLETTVTKLQSVLALSPEQVSAIPPPVVRIRELENENISLRRENESLRHQLEEKIALLRPDITRRNITLPDDRRDDRDMKRRRTVDHAEDVYMVSPSLHCNCGVH